MPKFYLITELCTSWFKFCLLTSNKQDFNRGVYTKFLLHVSQAEMLTIHLLSQIKINSQHVLTTHITRMSPLVNRKSIKSSLLSNTFPTESQTQAHQPAAPRWKQEPFLSTSFTFLSGPAVQTTTSTASRLPDQMSRVLCGYQTRQWTSCCRLKERCLTRKCSFPLLS